jgi:hypothetical protein
MSYTFGPFRYDVEQKLLFRASEVVPLVPKVVETLQRTAGAARARRRKKRVHQAALARYGGRRRRLGA